MTTPTAVAPTPATTLTSRYVAATKTTSFGTDVVILDARNGTELIKLTNDELSFNPVWSPLMDSVAYFKLDHGLVDLWLIPLTGTAPNWTVGQPIALTISAGLDATLLASLNTRLKWRFGRSAILGHGLREWWRYAYPRIELIADGERLEATFVSVSNIPFYAGSFRLAPDARTDDGRFELVTFRGSGRAAMLGFALDVVRSAHVRRKDVEIRRVREVVLEAPAGALAQVDGDVCQERLPLTIGFSPERLLVLAPDPTPGEAVRKSP